PVWRHAGETHSVLLEPSLVADIDLVAVTVPLGNFRHAVVDFRNLAAALEYRRIGAEPHGAAKVAGDAALLKLVAFHPCRHQTDDGFRGRTELGRVRRRDAAEIAR